VQKISTELRPSLLDNLGLAAAIEWQLKELGKRTGMEFELSTDPEEFDLDRGRSTAIFRIFQEVMTNVIRHANATMTKISLKKVDSKIVLEISDNGEGINEEIKANG
jgi:signal transduction histidine kinase